MTDDDSAAKSITETPQQPHNMVKEVEQVIEEKTGRKKKEYIHNAIEAIQIAKVATSKGEGQVVDEGREEAVVAQSNRVSIKCSNWHVEDINIDQPDMV